MIAMAEELPRKKINIAQRKKNIVIMRDKDKEPVKGIFKFYEVAGGSMSFVYKKYKGEPVRRYDLVDGEMYTLPRGVAKHLNKNGWYPVHAFNIGDDGKTTTLVGKKVRRFGFQSLEFIDYEDLNEANINDVITVEQM